MSKKIEEGRGKGLSNKELNRLGVEQRKTIEAIHTVEKAMNLPVGTLKTGSTGFIALKNGRFTEQEILWVLADNFKRWLDSGAFQVLVLDDEIYDMADEPMVALAAVHEAIDWAMAWQHLYASPFYFAFGDADAGYLEIMVKKYNTDMYKDEIKKQGGSGNIST